MKKLVIFMLTVLTLFTTTSTLDNTFTPVASAQSVWVELHGNGRKYHSYNPGRRFGRGKVNHHWTKVSLSWAKANGYTKSLR
ncbi:hypothetical protein [Nicoliella lavandulae]|uniref:Uncharacterized protein n=1 Tax=Nicoliella lavandulae TaxID=3082954 RepID=A0ABU8SNI4_9LACO